MRSIASYNAGKTLCRLSWHLKQLVLRPRNNRLNQITQEIEELGRIAREMVTELQTREFLQIEIQRLWQSFDFELCFSEDYANWCVEDAVEIHQRVWRDQSVANVAPIRREYCKKLLWRGTNLVSALHELLISILGKDPEISQFATSAFVFGEFVEQVRHHPAVAEHMYKEIDAPQQVYEPHDAPDYIGNYSPEPGEIKVTDSWFLDLQQLWRELGSQNPLSVDHLANRILSGNGGAPELLVRIDDAFKGHAEAHELFHTIKVELRRQSNDAVLHLAGEETVLRLDSGLFVTALLEANGRWITMPDLEKQYPELKGKKPSRLTKNLPKALSRLIESIPRTGSRLIKP